MAAARPYPKLSKEQQASFWKKIKKGPADECWPWIAKARKGRGYGALTVNKQPLSAHRVGVRGPARLEDPGQLDLIGPRRHPTPAVS